jgi:multimeric flavodoxin WrbA
MKVVAFNGSPHAKGNTYTAIKAVADVLEQQGIGTEIIHVGASLIHGCLGCGACFRNRNGRCVQDDEVNAWVAVAKDADGVIFGSPVYYAGVAGTMKSFMDRFFYVCGANGGLMRHKVGASVVAVRRAGGQTTFNELNHFLTISEMIVPGSSYWNICYGCVGTEAEQDVEGIHTMQVLGGNIAWLIKLIKAGEGVVQEPEAIPKQGMNFIR